VTPYILGDKEWPAATAVTESPDEAAEREANEAEATAAAAADEPATPPEEDEDEDDSLDIRRARIQSVSELRATHKAAIAPLNEILNKPEPEDEFSDEHKAWEREQSKALREKSKLQEDFQDALAEATITG